MKLPFSVFLRIPVVLAICAFAAQAALEGATDCRPVGNDVRQRLITYVNKKYKLPEAARATIKEVSIVPATCFRKLTFTSEDTKRNFKVDLFLSPDLRFLTPELLDSTLDPVHEERRKERDLAGALAGGNPPSIGRSTAPVTVAVFSDFQCPYCARTARLLTHEVLPVEKNIRVVFRHFPLSFHNWAIAAAQATACAQQQGDEYFWRLHDFIFERQQEFNTENIVQLLTAEAKRLRRFNVRRFEACVAEKNTDFVVKADMALGTKSGVRGTPTLFVNGRRIGPVSVAEHLRTVIREEAARLNAAR